MNLKFEFKTKDYVLLGILVAMYFVLYLVVGGILSAISMPVSYIISLAIIGLLAGILITFLLFKIPKMWIFTFFHLVLVLIYALMGITYLAMVLSVLCGAIIADFIANSSAYKSKVKNALAYGVSNLGMIGSMIIPIWFSKDYYAEKVTTVGATPEMVQGAINASIGWIGALTIFLSFLGGFLGIYLGYAVLSKHFKKQGK